MSLLMRDLHEAAGATFGQVDGVELPRHYGEPSMEYAAASGGVAVVDRSHRARLVVDGKAPLHMLSGVLTGRMPSAPVAGPDGTTSGQGEYSAVLTPKGRMLTDLRCFRLGAEEEEGVLLDVPAAGRGALRDRFAKFLPPRLARVRDESEATGMLTLVGAGSAALAATLAAAGLAEEDLSGLEEDEFRAVDSGETGLRIIRTAEVRGLAFDLVGALAVIRDLWAQALEAGARPAGQGVWQTLRVEAGRPAFGQDMDEATIPYEAGIVERAVDHVKGCYTGQEVIVRIRDRGHVNRLLRGLLLGDAPTPAVGIELFHGEQDKPVGSVTSAVSSPYFGESVALGYVRREVEPGDEVRVGSAEGARALVRDLDEGWGPRAG